VALPYELLGELAEAWLKVIPDPDEFQLFVRITLNRFPAVFIPPGSLYTMTYAVLRHVDDQNSNQLWREFLEALAQKYARNIELVSRVQSILRDLPPVEAIPPGIRPYEVVFIQGNFAFLDRADFRRHVEALSDPNSGARILTVKGEPLAGMSHSQQFLRHLEGPCGLPLRFRLAAVDIEEEATAGPATSRVARVLSATEVREVAVTIWDRACLPAPPLTTAPEPGERYPWRLAEWLARELRRTTETIWILLDSLDRVADTCLDAHNFLGHLAARVVADLRHVRLILIGYDRNWQPRVRPWVRMERLEGTPWLAREHVEEGFLAIARQFGVAQIHLDGVLSRLRQRLEAALATSYAGRRELADFLHEAARELFQKRPANRGYGARAFAPGPELRGGSE
jgi:hypothetical protein